MVQLRDLSQGHNDWICTIYLLWKDKQYHEEDNDNSLFPSDKFECTSQLYPSVDQEYGKGTYMQAT
jgi:hypothetical protein